MARWWGGGRYLGAPKNIVIHTTESSLRSNSAMAVASWLARTTYKASAHFVVDANQTIQIVDLADTAWGVGGSAQNASGVQIEIVGYASTTRENWLNGPEQRALCRAAALTALLGNTFDIPMLRVEPVGLQDGASGVVAHRSYSQTYGISNHTDPGPEFPWDGFLSQAAIYLEQAQLLPPLPQDVKKPDRPIAVGRENTGQPLPEFGEIVDQLDELQSLLTDLSQIAIGFGRNLTTGSRSSEPTADLGTQPQPDTSQANPKSP